MKSIETFDDSQTTALVNYSVIPVLLFFTGPNCSACKSFAPVLEQIAKDLHGEVTIGKIDVEQAPQTAQNYMVRSLPTSVFLKNGVMQETKTGVSSRADYLKFIMDNL